MKKVLSALFLLGALCGWATGQTLTKVSISPVGASIKFGSNQQFTVTCTMSDNSTNNCTSVGTVTWSTTHPNRGAATDSNTGLAVNSSGLAHFLYDINSGNYGNGYVRVTVGGKSDKARVYEQHSGDTWVQYMTPEYKQFKDTETDVPFNMNVVVGSTIQAGTGILINRTDSGTGSPFQETCNWVSSDTSKATVDRIGQVTAVAPGSVNITCGRAGDAVFGTSDVGGWQAPGNFITLTVILPTLTTAQTFHVRGDGGLPWVDANTTPNGQCDGLTNVAAAGATAHHCAWGNMRYAWSDETTYQQLRWRINPGDTLIVHQYAPGYVTGLSQPVSSGWSPTNCQGNDSGCHMPSIPSGTAARHTRILGENFANCRSDSAKTKLLGTWGEYTVIDIRDSQFVDVACFDIGPQGNSCAGNGAYTNVCDGSQSTFSDAVQQTPLTGNVTVTDMFLHGGSHDALHGGSGPSVVFDHVRMRSFPNGGVNMDGNDWNSGNLTVAGGFTLTNSITEFIGCVEDKVNSAGRNANVLECRGQSLGAYGDGLGTAATAGDWTFDHDIWRYNMQDGLDLLHSGMRSLTVTNSQSYTNDGQAYKIGSGQTVVFANNISFDNCYRIGVPILDAPSSAFPAGETLCRANDELKIAMQGDGTDYVYFNTFLTTHAVSWDMFCADGWDDCTGVDSRYKNNIEMSYADHNQPNPSDALSGAFYESNGHSDGNEDRSKFPANQGWAVRDHNIFFNMKPGTFTLLSTETSGNPKFLNQYQTATPIPTPLSSETLLDPMWVSVTTGSAAINAGTPIAGFASDNAGNARSASTPTIGALEFGATATGTGLSITGTPLSVAAGSDGTLRCIETFSDSSTADVSSSATWSTSDPSRATVSGGTVHGVAAGSATISCAFNSLTLANTGAVTVTAVAPSPGLNHFEFATDWIQPGNAGDEGGPNPNKQNGVFTYTAATALGQKVQFNAAGNYPYNNGYWYRTIGTTYAATRQYDYVLKISFPSDADLNASQALEWELQQNISGQMINMAWAMDFQTCHCFQTFNYATSQWINTTIPVTRAMFAGGAEVSLDSKFFRTGNTVTHVSVTVNGTVYPVNITRTSTAETSGDYLNAAFQLDSNGVSPKPTPYSVRVRDMGVVLSNTAPPVQPPPNPTHTILMLTCLATPSLTKLAASLSSGACSVDNYTPPPVKTVTVTVKVPPTWTTIGKENETVSIKTATAAKPVTVRYGAPGNWTWIQKVFTKPTTFKNTNGFWGYDPVVGTLKVAQVSDQ